MTPACVHPRIARSTDNSRIINDMVRKGVQFKGWAFFENHPEFTHDRAPRADGSPSTNRRPVGDSPDRVRWWVIMSQELWRN